MSHVKVWIHAVWGTKNRQPILSKDIRFRLFSHIRENARQKSLFIDIIDGYTDHVHCLFALNADMPLSKALQLIKGEAAHWANQQELVPSKLEWADEYFAVSVSESMLDKVREYIRKQETHHEKVSFQQEYESFISKFKFSAIVQ